jgi:hypothetical protein
VGPREEDLTVLPTLNGRIQTRIAVLAVVGGLWTLLLTPLLPLGGSLGDAYPTTFTILLTTIVLGVGWELPTTCSCSSAGRRTGPRCSV